MLNENEMPGLTCAAGFFLAAQGVDRGQCTGRLNAEQEAALAAAIRRGPDPERDGVCAWTRADLCRWLEANFAMTLADGPSDWTSPAKEAWIAGDMTASR